MSKEEVLKKTEEYANKILETERAQLIRFSKQNMETICEGIGYSDDLIPMAVALAFAAAHLGIAKAIRANLEAGERKFFGRIIGDIVAEDN